MRLRGEAESNQFVSAMKIFYNCLWTKTNAWQIKYPPYLKILIASTNTSSIQERLHLQCTTRPAALDLPQNLVIIKCTVRTTEKIIFYAYPSKYTWESQSNTVIHPSTLTRHSSTKARTPPPPRPSPSQWQPCRRRPPPSTVPKILLLCLY